MINDETKVTILPLCICIIQCLFCVHRGIVKEMGLTGKITPDQVAKKWDNLKTKFKVTTV